MPDRNPLANLIIVDPIEIERCRRLALAQVLRRSAKAWQPGKSPVPVELDANSLGHVGRASRLQQITTIGSVKPISMVEPDTTHDPPN